MDNEFHGDINQRPVAMEQQNNTVEAMDTEDGELFIYFYPKMNDREYRF